MTLALPAGDYAVYYEVCEGDEVYYRFTLVPVAACCLLDDPWGGAQSAPLYEGTV